MLGIEKEYTHFDPDLIININSALLSLNQIGIGPELGFYIQDDTDKWEDLIDSRKDIEAIKSYIFLKVKLAFDPPSNSFAIESIEKQATELIWRLNTQLSKK